MRRKKKKKETVYTKEKYRKIVQKRRNPFYSYFLSTSRGGGYSTYRRGKKLVKLVAPQNFSISSNIDKTLQFFDEFNLLLNKHKRIYLDMSKIKSISEDAILYLVSRLHYYFIKYSDYDISGNFPEDKKCEDLLLESHFTKYVMTGRKKIVSKSEIFPIRDGYLSDGNVIGEVLEFVQSKISLDEDNSFDIYGPMLECLTNTKNHAYKSQVTLYEKWWLIAIPDKKAKRVHYTTLDNGLGIPTTVKKNFFEKVKLFTDKTDAELIISALNGGYRTRTGKVERGKGLPSIFESTSNSQIDNLTIISNFGYIRAGKSKTISEKRNLSRKFHGTMISWDFIE